MELDFRSSGKRWTAIAGVVLAAGVYLGVGATRFVADCYASSSNLADLQRAARLAPASAEYKHALGLFELVRQAPGSAAAALTQATQLNPNSANYWMDLAVAQQLAGDTQAERRSIDHALAADSHSPDIAWQAANLLLAQGATEDAMRQFHTVLENDPTLTMSAIDTAWKVRPDVDYLLENVVPAPSDSAFLDFLLSRTETSAAAKVWDRMFSSREQVQRRELLGYVRYLIAHQEVSQASLVWQQGGIISDVAAYQPSAENLIVNGDFSLENLNGGFDWMHQQVQGVTLALDPTETNSSSRSLCINLEGPGIADAGIAQRVVVEPNQTYEFSASYKAREMDGAGGMELAIHDAYTGAPLYVSEDLRNADFWKKTGGSFTTGPKTNLVIVHVVRVPAASPIRGKLWIDGLQLVQKGSNR